MLFRSEEERREPQGTVVWPLFRGFPCWRTRTLTHATVLDTKPYKDGGSFIHAVDSYPFIIISHLVSKSIFWSSLSHSGKLIQSKARIPRWSSGWESVLSLQRAQVQSQVTQAAPYGTGPKKGTEMGKSMLQVENYKWFLYYSLTCVAFRVMVNLRWGVDL